MSFSNVCSASAIVIAAFTCIVSLASYSGQDVVKCHRHGCVMVRN
jgi:hypothetical protein